MRLQRLFHLPGARRRSSYRDTILRARPAAFFPLGGDGRDLVQERAARKRERVRLAVDLAVISLFGVLASFSALLLAAQPVYGHAWTDNGNLVGGFAAPLVAVGLVSILMALAPRVRMLPAPLRLVLALFTASLGTLAALWLLWP